ncbi:DNA-3-methyladenine glycosylase I [Tolumonas osonensis]|uniref:DNA-3-methyladenine glycosylase I n=1 Tax=Tolumonas osonensis TaxID=675874 RepID=A0A841GMT0_9GAMM|nr:DNA-3-methyladenine glycosylase I [Tolumonas osonensis]MBB6056615.1 DNA-3-methyladenine glycosylase I [Tolumonas osonensis]
MERHCAWIMTDPDYIAYHDQHWGRPEYDDRKLFAMLCLEGQQAGLSWLTILKRIPDYHRLFADFDPVRLAEFDEAQVQALMSDSRIIRNRLKIQAIIQNARAYLALQQQGISFSEWIWQFVGGQPVVNHWQQSSEVPAVTPQAEAMSKALKKAGFKFVGPTICYAYMQAVGMVNDHLIDCPWHSLCNPLHS